MYITVQEAVELTGLPQRTIYHYAKTGLLRTDPESKKTMINIEDVYKLREEKRS